MILGKLEDEKGLVESQQGIAQVDGERGSAYKTDHGQLR